MSYSDVVQLILTAVLTGITGWYAISTRQILGQTQALADQTRRLAEETKSMAEATRRMADQNEAIVEETRRSTHILEVQLGLDARISGQPKKVVVDNIKELSQPITDLLKEYIKERGRNQVR